MSLSRISCEQAHELMHNSCCQILDIRDPQSYQLSRPAGAKPLDNNTLPAFLNEADRQAPTLVFCYHGNSSQQAALFLQQEGFTEVHSVDGGFGLWRQLYPNDIES